MNAINPFWTLWFPLAVAGVAVPVIIHLLSRYRSRQMDWAAMELLKRAMVVRSRRLRLEDLILLLLRCLAAALIAMTLCRPVLTQAGGGSEQEASNGVLIALDGSFSMAHKPGIQNSRFDDAVKRAQDVLDTVRPGAPVTLVVMGNRANIIVRDKAYDHDAFKEELRKLAPTPERLDLENCLGEIEKMVSQTKAASRECFLITDAQANSWTNVSGAAALKLKALQETCRVFFMPVGTRQSENLAITRLAVGSGVLRAGATVQYVVEVENSGADLRNGVKVQLFLAGGEAKAPVPAGKTPAAGAAEILGVLKDERILDRVGPKETVSVPLFVRFDKPGLYVLSARLRLEGQEGAGDGLSIDDTRYSVADIRPSVNVLCVDGSPSSERFKGGTDFLAVALASQGMSGTASGSGSGSGLTVDAVAAGNFEVSRLGGYDVVFLVNVPELDKFRVLALEEFVRRGGGLVVFLGDKINATQINTQMVGRNSTPLLPAQIGARQKAAADGRKPSLAEKIGLTDKGGQIEGWPLAPNIPYHPITGVFARMKREHWTNIRFREYFKVVPVQGAQTLLRVSPSDDPLLLEQSLGRGRVVLCTTTANRDWNDMVLSPAYLMMMQQAVTHLTRKVHEAPHTVGQRLVFDLPTEAPAKVSVAAGDPVDRQPPAVQKIDASERDGQKVADAGPAARPGVYTVDWKGCAAPLKAAVNVDPRESDLAVLRDKALTAAAGKLALRLVGEKEDVQAAVRESRKGREIWFTLLMIALAALAAEAVLGRLFSRRMSGGSESPVPAPARL